tara:strand:+ start:266 stop:499 length:234 start_codon:yes stop_codon:yes gene_type:complete
MQTQFSQDYRVDERYRGTDNRSQTLPLDNIRPILEVNKYAQSLRKARNFRRGSARDPEFPPRFDNKEVSNISNINIK